MYGVSQPVEATAFVNSFSTEAVIVAGSAGAVVVPTSAPGALRLPIVEVRSSAPDQSVRGASA